MHRSVHARRLAREALERVPPAIARAVGDVRVADAGDATREALVALADRHLARREVAVIDATHGDPGALLAALEADVPALALAGSGGAGALADALEGRRVDALHLFCTGGNAALDIGGARLAPLRPSARDRAALARLAATLGGNGAERDGPPVLHLYGSSFGTGGEGRAAARALARALRAAVVATQSDGADGDPQPDWQVEVPAPSGVAGAATARAASAGTGTATGRAANPTSNRKSNRTPNPGSNGAPSIASRPERSAAVPAVAAPAAAEPVRPSSAPAGSSGTDVAVPLKRENGSTVEKRPVATPPLPTPSVAAPPVAVLALAGDPFSVLGSLSLGTLAPRVARVDAGPSATSGASDRAVPGPAIETSVSSAAFAAGAVSDGQASDRAPQAAESPSQGPRADAGPCEVARSERPRTPERAVAPERTAAAGPRVVAKGALRVRALAVEAWFRAEPGVGEQALLGGDNAPSDAPRMALDGPRLVFAVPTPQGERRAVADLSRLGIEDASVRLVHAVGTVRENWACLYVEGALAATARLEGAHGEWSVPHRAPRAAAFEGELGLARLYTRALAGREVLANHRATRGEGKAAAGALWSTGPLTGRAPAAASEPAAPVAAAPVPGADAIEVPSAPPAPRTGDEPDRLVTSAPEIAADPDPDPDTVVASEPAVAAHPRVRRRGEPLTRPDPFGPRVARVRTPPGLQATRLPAATGGTAADVDPTGSDPARAAAPVWTVAPGEAAISLTGGGTERVPAPSAMPEARRDAAPRVRRTGTLPPAASAVAERETVSLREPPSAISSPPSSDATPDAPTFASKDGPEGGSGDLTRVELAREPAERAPTAIPASGRGVAADPSASPSRSVPPPSSEPDGAGTERADAPAASDAAPDGGSGEASRGASTGARPMVLRVAPGREVRLDVAELAGCALIDAIAHWPVDLPDWLALDGLTGVVTGTVPARAAGTRERVAVAAANRHGATATLAVLLEIEAVRERAPVATADDPFVAFEAAMRTAADALPALRAMLRAGAERGGTAGEPSAARTNVAHEG